MPWPPPEPGLRTHFANRTTTGRSRCSCRHPRCRRSENAAGLSRVPARETGRDRTPAPPRASEVALALLHLHRPVLVVIDHAILPFRAPDGNQLLDDLGHRIGVRP